MAKAQRLCAKGSPQAGLWDKGAEGERVVSESLEVLRAKGFTVLEDVQVPASKANIDHIVIGPTGVFVIDTKSWSGRVVVGESLRQNGHRRDDDIAKLLGYRDRVSAIAATAVGAPVPVWAVMCFVGDGVEQQRVYGDVRCINLETLLPFIEGAPTKLPPLTVSSIATLVATKLVPYGSVIHRDGLRPREDVFFLEPWRKHGHDRVYVTSSDGVRLGHLDLRAKRVVAPTASGAGALGRLLHDTLADDDDEPRRDRAGAPVVVVRRWRKAGADRLYVTIIERDGRRTKLGSIDVPTNTTSIDDPRLHWCASAHRRLATT